MTGDVAARPEPLATVVVVGLGPAGPELTTPQAREAIASAPVVLVRTSRHLAAEPLVAAGARPLDEHYERNDTFAATYESIVEDVVAEALEHGRVVYAVPGSPAVLESSVARLRADGRVRVESVPGMSFLDLAWDRLGIDPVAAGVRLVDGQEFAAAAARAEGPLLVAHTYSKAVLSDVKLAVAEAPTAPVTILHHLGLADEAVVAVMWSELDRTIEADHLTCVFVPGLESPPGAGLARLEQVVEVLRLSCPWDREQTHRSLVRHLLEETYEAIEAIEELGEPAELAGAEHLEEELGDVLCQVMFHSVIAREEGLFELGDVARTVREKLVHRHPHVFGASGELASAGAVEQRWEQIKQLEKGRSSLMEGIPAALPALALVAKLERKANSVELGAGQTAPGDAELAAALAGLLRGETARVGELLLGVARRAAAAGTDPEEALRRAAGGFRARFRAAESAAAAAGTTLQAATPAQRRALWEATVG